MFITKGVAWDWKLVCTLFPQQDVRRPRKRRIIICPPYIQAALCTEVEHYRSPPAQALWLSPILSSTSKTLTDTGFSDYNAKVKSLHLKVVC